MRKHKTLYQYILMANIAIYANKIFKHRWDNREHHIDISELNSQNTKIDYWNEDTKILILSPKFSMDVIEFNRKKFIQKWSNRLLYMVGIDEPTPLTTVGAQCLVADMLDEGIENINFLNYLNDDQNNP